MKHTFLEGTVCQVRAKNTSVECHLHSRFLCTDLETRQPRQETKQNGEYSHFKNSPHSWKAEPDRASPEFLARKKNFLFSVSSIRQNSKPGENRSVSFPKETRRETSCFGVPQRPSVRRWRRSLARYIGVLSRGIWRINRLVGAGILADAEHTYKGEMETGFSGQTSLPSQFFPVQRH